MAPPGADAGTPPDRSDGVTPNVDPHPDQGARIAANGSREVSQRAEVPHGTPERFRRARCRCEDCCAADRRDREFRRRRPVPDEPVEGRTLAAQAYARTHAAVSDGNVPRWALAQLPSYDLGNDDEEPER